MKKTLLFTLFILTLFSCSKKVNPNAVFSTLQPTPQEKTIALTIALDTPVKATLKVEDAVKTIDSLPSYYHQYQFVPEFTRNYMLELSSLCNCFGFKKYMFNPEIKVLDVNQVVIETVLDTVSFDYRMGPISLNKKWLFKGVRKEPITIMVYSNNEALGKPIDSFDAKSTLYTGGLLVPLVIPITLKSTLVGKYQMKLSENFAPIKN